MKINRFVNRVFNSNSYLIYEGNNAVIIDIGDFEPILKFIQDNNLKIKALLLTHTHYDHIYGIREFIKVFPFTPVYTSVFGKEALMKPNWNFSRYHEDPIAIESPMIQALNNENSIQDLNGHTIKVLATPGHDKSCLTYMMDYMLFTGDSYIPGTKVIASFPNSDISDAKIWYDKLKIMSESYDIYPGHSDIHFSRISGRDLT